MSIVATLAPVGPGTTRVRLRVPLDVRTTPDIRHELAAVVRSGEGPIVIDMTDSTIADSTGFAALVAAHVRAANRGRRMRVVGADVRTSRLLRRAGLGQLLEDATTSGRATRRPPVAV